jgi:2'-5' RNA ligase
MHSDIAPAEFNQYRYAVYLIPPYNVSHRVEEIHRLLAKQFGFAAAAKFQVHATLKGFFKCSECTIDRLIANLDPIFENQEAFPVHFEGFHIDDVGFGLDVSRIGDDPNLPLHEFRSRVVDAVKPYIAGDCDFVESDLGSPFKAHITLAFRDISPEFRDSVLAYIEPALLPSEPFSADTFHLLEFHSEDWEGCWDKTLTWRLLKSWRLG